LEIAGHGRGRLHVVVVANQISRENRFRGQCTLPSLILPPNGLAGKSVAQKNGVAKPDDAGRPAQELRYHAYRSSAGSVLPELTKLLMHSTCVSFGRCVASSLAWQIVRERRDAAQRLADPKGNHCALPILLFSVEVMDDVGRRRLHGFSPWCRPESCGNLRGAVSERIEAI
jgi:hypothetical protein